MFKLNTIAHRLASLRTSGSLLPHLFINLCDMVSVYKDNSIILTAVFVTLSCFDIELSAVSSLSVEVNVGIRNIYVVFN
jgi:hypothetical protein